METKRKFEEEPISWVGGKAGIPEAPGPPCSNLRPPLTDLTQSDEDVVSRSFEKFKRLGWRRPGIVRSIRFAVAVMIISNGFTTSRRWKPLLRIMDRMHSFFTRGLLISQEMSMCQP